ncbi:TrkH family potassium uptake protein [Nanoarchaeota archaeon]
MKIVTYYLGWILILSALFRIPPLIVAFIYQESIIGLLISIGVSLLVGYLCIKFTDKESILNLNIQKGLVLATLSFIVLSLIGAIPFFFHFQGNWFQIFTNSFFESVSGFTTTGMSVIENLSTVPMNLQFWRAEMQWIGGIGIILVFLFIFSRLKKESSARKSGTVESISTLYQSGGFSEKLEPSIGKSTKRILLIYTLFTIVGVLLLLLIGTNLFDSFTLTFTSLSTGGFNVVNGFDAGQMVVIVILMILGATSFITLNRLIGRRFHDFAKDSQMKYFFGFVFLVTLLVIALHENFGNALFNIISTISTTGHLVGQIGILPPLFLFLVVLLMLIGGSLGSTSGGIKIFRVQVMLNSIGWFLKKLARPSSAVTPFKLNNKTIEEEQVMIIHTFIFCYVLVIIVSTIILMLVGYDFMTSSFQTISALGTVGFSSVSIMGMHVIAKYVLILVMILGRLEIFPVLLAINLWLKRKSGKI